MEGTSKKTIKTQLAKWKDKLEDLRLELENIKDDCESTASDIEPYEGRNELTLQQQARQEWFENTASELDDIMSDLETNCGTIDDLLSYTE